METEQLPQKLEDQKPKDKKRNRWWLYLFTGLIIGIAYWHYLNGTAMFFNDVFVNVGHMLGEAWQIWLLLPVTLLAYFGVWLIPAIFVAVYESRHSKTPYLSALAVAMVGVSGVLGYYVNHVAIYRTFNLFDFNWVAVGVIGGGFVGYVTNLLYSRWMKKKDHPLNVEQLETTLHLWEKGLYIAWGAGLMLLLMALLQMHRMYKSEVWEWYIAWLILEALVAPPGFFILFLPRWRRIPLRERMDTAYGYFAVAWLGLFAFGVQTGSDPRNWDYGIMTIASLIIVGIGLLIALTYWLLRRVEMREEAFP
ncbi:MAG: hypothetical protein KJ935_08005 [Candidatus Omnitrophica bacterium]|nr:hypothetical protein [Candidatus Omnitrophota bacterium]